MTLGSVIRQFQPEYVDPTGSTRVRCAARVEDRAFDGTAYRRVRSYSEHDGAWDGKTGQTVRLVPWAEAVFHPPICHGVPMVTLGGWAMLEVIEAIERFGLPLGPCRQRFGYEGWDSCRAHGWVHSSEWTLPAIGDECGNARLAALMDRRHGYVYA